MREERAVVFVIDDDASLRGALHNLLSSVGLDVQVSASGATVGEPGRCGCRPFCVSAAVSLRQPFDPVALFHFDLVVPHHLGPSLPFGGDDRGKLGRRSSRGHVPELTHVLAVLLGPNDLA